MQKLYWYQMIQNQHNEHDVKVEGILQTNIYLLCTNLGCCFSTIYLIAWGHVSNKI